MEKKTLGKKHAKGQDKLGPWDEERRIKIQ